MANLEKYLKRIIYVLIVGAFVSCLFIFKSWIFPYITSKSIPFRIIVELMVLAYIILALKFPKYRPKKSWILYSLLIFTGIAIITSIFGINPKLSFIGDLERMWALNTWIHLILFFIIVTSVLKTKKEWFSFLNISLIFCSYIAIYGYLQRWGVEGIFQTGITRIQSVLGNSAYVAGLLLLSSILSFYLLIKTRGFWWKLLFALHIFIQLPAMFMAEIRGAQIAFFFVLLVISIALIFRLKDKKIKFGIISFLILLAVIFGLAFSNKEADWVKNNSVLHRLTSISLSSGTVRTRLISWEGGLKAFQERPIMGYGMENYYYAFDKYFQADYYNIAPTETWFDRAHNMVMENLVAHGIFGLLAYFSIFIIALVYLYKVYKKDEADLSSEAFLTSDLSAVVSTKAEDLSKEVAKEVAKEEGLDQRSRVESRDRSGKKQNWLFSLFFGSLIIAYFIQNIFVFDSLAVTMFFFFLLAYINFKVTDNLEKELVYEKQLPKMINGMIISLGVILGFYLIFGMNFTHARIAKQNYIVQKSFYQDQDFNKTLDEVQKLYKINSYLNRDSSTMIVDTLTKVASQVKTQEQAQPFFRIIDLLINKFKEYEKINDQDAYMKLNLARLYMLKASFLNINSEDRKVVLEDANEILQKAIGLSPERLHNYYFLAKVQMTLGQAEQAIESLKKALDYNSEYADTYLYLSQAYQTAGNQAEADRYLKKAYELKPSLRKE